MTNNLQDALNKLKKLLKNLPEEPGVEHVHQLRTQVRRVEELLKATEIGPRKKLLRAVTPIRRAAGAVRDVDVFVGKAAELASEEPGDELTHLLERLGEMRVKHVRKLLDVIDEERRGVQRGLKRYSSWLEQHAGEEEKPIEAHVAAGAMRIAEELAHWPPLAPENLHTFRIRVKALRYVLQLSEPSNRQLIQTLGRVKDAIGTWHDWQELSMVAEQILGRSDTALLRRIDAEAATAKKRALVAAQAVRTRYLNAAPAKHSQKKQPHGIALRAAVELAG